MIEAIDARWRFEYCTKYLRGRKAGKSFHEIDLKKRRGPSRGALQTSPKEGKGFELDYRIEKLVDLSSDPLEMCVIGC